jgi:hypothetical protein
MSEQTLVERAGRERIIATLKRLVHNAALGEGLELNLAYLPEEAADAIHALYASELSRLSEALRKAEGERAEPDRHVGRCYVCGEPATDYVWDENGDLPACALHRTLTASGVFQFLSRKYVQRADERQRSMGLQYMEAETHDLAAEIARLIQAALSTPMPSEGGGSSVAGLPSAAVGGPITEAEGPGGWRPIESAPKDGRRLDLWVPRHPETATSRRVPDCRWGRPRWDRRLGPGEPAADYATWCDALGHGGYEPTHWMPPPAPPSSAKQVVGDSSRDEQPPRTGEG